MRTQLESVRRDGDRFRINGRASVSEAAWVVIALSGISFVGLFGSGVPVLQRGLSLVVGLGLAAGLLGMMRPDEVVLDPRLRTWTRQTGYWSGRTRTGAFDEIEGLVLAREGIRPTRWVIRLAIRGDHEPIRVAVFSSESKAYERCGALARTLHVDAIDLTAARETPLSLEAIRRPLPTGSERRQARTATMPPLPPGSAIHIAGVPPAVRIVLPSLGLSAAGVLVGVVGVVLGSLFTMFGVILWANRVGDTDGLPGATYPLVLSFVVIGTCIILFTFAMCIGRGEFQNRGDQLVFGYRLFDHLTLAETLAMHSIEEITVRTASGQFQGHVFVRTSNRTLRVGFTMGRQDQEWLQSALTSWLND